MFLYKTYLRLKKALVLSRNRFLKKNLGYLGKGAMVHLDVTFINPLSISIGKNSRLFKGVYLKSRKKDSKGIRIGENVKIHEYSYIDDYGGLIEIDDFAGIGHHCVIGGHGGLYIGKYSMIAGHTYIVPANHSFDNSEVPFVNQHETKKGIHIGSNVWIGAGCIILDGVTIGNNSVIGAGSVVTKDVKEGALIMGPAASLKRMIQNR